MKNWFFRFLTSGFGTDTMAGKAVGWTIAICLIGLWIFIWLIKVIYKAIVGEKVPNFKSGPYSVEITAVGNAPKELKKQLRFDKTEAQLVAADPSQGVNVMGLIRMVTGKLFKHKESKKERFRRMLEEY